MVNKTTNTNSISLVEGFEGTLFVKECHDVKILYRKVQFCASDCCEISSHPPKLHVFDPVLLAKKLPTSNYVTFVFIY